MVHDLSSPPDSSAHRSRSSPPSSKFFPCLISKDQILQRVIPKRKRSGSMCNMPDDKAPREAVLSHLQG